MARHIVVTVLEHVRIRILPSALIRVREKFSSGFFGSALFYTVHHRICPMVSKNEQYAQSYILSLMIRSTMQRSLPAVKCPIQISLSVIGGKWKPIILWFLRDGPVRFSEIQRKIPGITQMMLAKQLRELVADGMLERTVYPEVPPRVDYCITDDGRSVFPVLVALNEWGNEYQKRKYGSWSQKCADTFRENVTE
jgi:DNA-binding HxlR family transcriptional regulator